MIAIEVSSSHCSPKVLVPRHCLDTCSPLRPSRACFMPGTLPPTRPRSQAQVTCHFLQQVYSRSMVSGMSTSGTTRQDRVLAVALEVFGRYGYRKTSMDEVARSAAISRQGLYLHFASKEALFRAAVRQELDAALADASRCLNEEGAALEHRVVAALDAWLGRYVESRLAADISNLMQDSSAQLGDMVTAAIAAFDAQLASAIAEAMTEDD